MENNIERAKTTHAVLTLALTRVLKIVQEMHFVTYKVIK